MKRILVIDDEPDLLTLMEDVLTGMDYKVITAANGEEGLPAAEREKPDMIVLDIVMPGIDGFEVCRRLKKSPDLSAIPVVMITSFHDSDQKKKSLEAGAEDFITKPLNSYELQTRINAIFQLQELRNRVRYFEKKKRGALIQILLDSGIITEAQAKRSDEEGRKPGKSGETFLLESGLVSKELLQLVRDLPSGIKCIKVGDILPSENVICRLPVEMARQYTVIPLSEDKDKMIIAMADPMNVCALADLKFIMNTNIEPVFSSPAGLKYCIDKYYSPGREKAGDSEVSAARISGDKENINREMSSESSVREIVDEIISRAAKDGASDIHLEPYEKEICLRHRIDGFLHTAPPPQKELYNAIISRIKIMADLNIAEKRMPQDGRMSARVDNKDIDIRVATVPTLQGEGLVMRLLDNSGLRLNLEELGFSDHCLKAFRALIKKPHGIILITGPTGSGKTTTIYSALSEINSGERKIITIEDPVEYNLKGVSQIPVRPGIGLTFATGLRSILRLDPDIILVGEIRDAETAQIAVQAALTGHLVFSTLHTNDAVGAITRLIDMGVEPFLIASSVIGIIAQRLVRIICPRCREKYTAEKNISGIPSGLKNLYRGKGCQHCRDTGYKGRVALYEFLQVNEDTKRIIAAKYEEEAIKAAAKEMSMETIYENGIVRVSEGVTSLEEVLRVTQFKD